MAVAAQNTALNFQQRYLQEKFHRYRYGLPGAGVGIDTLLARERAGDAAATVRLAGIRARPLPGVVSYQFTQGVRDRLRRIATAKRTYIRNQGPPPVRSLGQNSKEAVKDEFNNVRALLGTTFRFVKCLGWGGNGIVTLWRYKPPRGQEHRVVMKQPTLARLRPGRSPALATDGISREKICMSMLCRAPHIVQRFLMSNHPAGGPANPGRTRSSSRRVEAMAGRVDEGTGYILMDYCRFGTLDSQLSKAANDDQGTRYFPDSVLWRIFDCLVKACMAMECPPRFAPGNAAPGAGIPVSISGGYLPEVDAPVNDPMARGIVHFDIEPTNVFVRDFDAPAAGLGHTEVPRVQIGDFGGAKFEAELWAAANAPGIDPVRQVVRRTIRWKWRNTGKLGYSLPEQFSKDWDMIPANKDPSDPGAWSMWPWVPPPPISSGPGRFTSASNIWQIGNVYAQVMKMCMTLCNPNEPPYAGRMTSEEPVLPAGVPVPAGQERWTYGWDLLNPEEPWLSRYQRPLLDLVARCLMAKQEFRPTLQQLQAVITAQIGIQGSVAAAVPPYWTNTFFSVPRPPQPPRDTEFADPLDPFWDYRDHRPV